jgi:hypothetical protein
MTTKTKPAAKKGAPKKTAKPADLQTIDSILNDLPEPERSFCLKCRATSKQKYPDSYQDSQKAKTIADAIAFGFYWGKGSHAKRISAIHNRACSGEFDVISYERTFTWASIDPERRKAINELCAPMEPTRIDLILQGVNDIRERLALVESSVAVIRSGATFMQQLEKDAAKELGLKPVVEEPWVPKVGDIVVCDEPITNSVSPGWTEDQMNRLVGIPIQVTNNERACCVRAAGFLWRHEWLRPANPAEVTAYHAAKKEQGRKDKEGRLVFGQAVEYQDERGWRVATDKPFSSHTYLITKTGQARLEWARIDDLTIID